VREGEEVVVVNRETSLTWVPSIVLPSLLMACAWTWTSVCLWLVYGASDVVV
jgi:hypothetical protein